MKGTIKSKMVFSYIILVVICLLFTSILFNYTAKKYLENEIKEDLITEAKIEQNLFKTKVNDMQLKLSQTDQIKEKILLWRKDLIILQSTIKNLPFSSKTYFVIENNNNELRLLSNDNIAFLDNIKSYFLDNPIFSKTNIDGQSYYFLTYPFVSELYNSKTVLKSWVLMYVPIVEVQQLTHDMIKKLIFSMGASLILAILLGTYFANSIANPVKKLKYQAKKLAKREFETKVNISTNDELEDLSNTINQMAIDLKEYDISQKRFIQNASHELKTPLMSIQGYAEGLKDGVFDDKNNALDIIVDESIRLKTIVEELIFLSKLETLEGFYKIEPNSINEIIEESIEKIKSLAMKQNIKIINLLGKDITLNVDKNKMTQAIINILSNCLRYATTQIEIQSSFNDKVFKLSISDDGIGFKENEAQKIFERFYKGNKGNTGLGLSITKAIIEKHGGSIIAKNNKDKGATFIIKI